MKLAEFRERHGTMSNHRSGRAAFDERGNAIWEWEVAPGVFSRDIGTGEMKILLADSAIPAEPVTAPVKGADPYSMTTEPQPSLLYSPPAQARAPVPASERRRTPADMRKLSLAIIAARGGRTNGDKGPSK
jgi:hypothetical protein